MNDVILLNATHTLHPSQSPESPGRLRAALKLVQFFLKSSPSTEVQVPFIVHSVYNEIFCHDLFFALLFL